MTSKKQKAMQLRRHGKSFSYISQKLQVPKSTLSYWLHGIIPPLEYVKTLSLRRAAMLSAYNKKRAQKLKIQRIKRRLMASMEVSPSTKRDLWFAGLGLYWGDGSKTESHRLTFTNAEPHAIAFMILFFTTVCKVESSAIIIRIHIHNNQNRQYKNIQKFWQSITKLPARQFRKPIVATSKTSRRKKRPLPFGTCRIIIDDSEKVDKVLGWLDGIKNKYAQACKISFPAATHS